MLRSLILSLIFSTNCFIANSQPGSGNCLRFNGNNYVDCGNPSGNIFDFTGNGTIEAWVKVSSTPPPANGATCYSILAKDERPGEFNKWIFGVQNGKLAFHINSPDANHNWVYSNPFTLELNKYYHFAMTKNSGNMVTFYVNSVNMGTFTLPHATTAVNSPLVIGYSEVALGMHGEIDDVRFWKRILTQNEIRDWMCRKLNTSHPAYSNLAAYFKLDEGTGTTTNNNHTGSTCTLTGGPQWQLSSAPLGDLATHDFVSTVKSASLSNAYGENFAVTTTNGNPNGIVVYNVDENPNSFAGINAFWKNDKYFGVFVAELNSSSSTYTATYNYTSNPVVDGTNECRLRLYKRKNNADTPWAVVNSQPNLTSHNITASGQSTEYVLTNSNEVSAECMNAISNIVNSYSPVLALNSCENKITVEDGLTFKAGDTVLIIQMKGAVIDSTNTINFGTITDYKNSGNYEFNYVKSKSGNIIELRNVLTRQYDIPIGKVQLIRVPYYASATVTSSLSCLPWDGSKGGVLAFNVQIH